MIKIDCSRGVSISNDSPDEKGVLLVVEAHHSWGPQGRSAGWVSGIDVKADIFAKDGAKLIYKHVYPNEEKLSRAWNGTRSYVLPEGVYRVNSVFRSYCHHETLVVVAANGTCTAREYSDKLALLEFFDETELLRLKQVAQEEQKKLTLNSIGDTALPELTGSEKQVSWACTLRVSHILNIGVWLDRMSTLLPTEPDTASDTMKNFVFGVFQEWLTEKTSATFWIENRASVDEMFRRRVRDRLEEALLLASLVAILENPIFKGWKAFILGSDVLR